MTAIVYVFWIFLVLPSGQIYGELHKYPDLATCEAAREINEKGNIHIPGFNISPECLTLKKPQAEAQDEPT